MVRRRRTDATAGNLVCGIGILSAGPPELVWETKLGGERLVEELEDEPLPQIFLSRFVCER